MTRWLLLSVLFVTHDVLAQDPQPAPAANPPAANPPAAAPPPAARPPAAPAAARPRVLAPGALTVIPPEIKEDETFNGPAPLPEITRGIAGLAWTPGTLPKSDTLLEQANAVTLHHPVWCLEFSFKPLRMVHVDVPQSTGKMQRRLIWYLIYRVRNVGATLQPVPEKTPYGKTLYPKIDKVAQPTIRFFPHIVLEASVRQLNGTYQRKSYLDRLIPVAIAPIQEREKLPKILNSVEMTQYPIPLSEERIDRGVWGVATWESVDPTTDFVAVYVKGLSNAYKVRDLGTYDPAGPPANGRLFGSKVLQINFWRPSDQFFEHEQEVRYGIPIVSEPAEQAQILSHYGLQERVAYRWLYR